MRNVATLLGLALFLSLQAPAAAETFLLKSGARIYGVEEKHPRGEPSDEWMTVRTSYGRVSFKKADLKRKLTKGEERSTLYIEEACVMSVEGEAFKSKDGGKSWLRIVWKVEGSESGTLTEIPPRVRAGEQVRTGKQSAIDLDVGWGLVRLASESLLELQMSNGATLKLTQGKMGARLEELPKGRRFRVETPEASMGVEGTKFIVERGVRTRLSVLSGRVRIGGTVVRNKTSVVVAADGKVTPDALTNEDIRFGVRLLNSTARPAIDWVRIPGGTFKMGSTMSRSPGWPKTEPIHDVQVGDFLLGRYEVTEGQYRQFLLWLATHGDGDLWPEGCPGETQPDYRCNADLGVPELLWSNDREHWRWSHPDLCVYQVGWRGAKAFSRWIGGRLPSEAEWEYAARAEVEGGPRWPANLEGTLRDHAWTAENSGPKLGFGRGWPGSSGEHEDLCRSLNPRPQRVGLKLPNPFGIYDMYGNTSEWVEDTTSEDYVGAPTDGSARVVRGVDQRIIRGGHWWNLATPEFMSPCSRWRFTGFSDARRTLTGFRVARDLPR